MSMFKELIIGCLEDKINKLKPKQMFIPEETVRALPVNMKIARDIVKKFIEDVNSGNNTSNLECYGSSSNGH